MSFSSNLPHVFFGLPVFFFATAISFHALKVQPMQHSSCPNKFMLQVPSTTCVHPRTVFCSAVCRVSAPRSEGTGLHPGPRHTKVVDNVTSCSPLGTKIFRVGLGLSVLCDWGWYKVKCLGLDTTVRQHYKSEH